MATKGERGDVPAPWGAWLAFGVAMVRSGGLPAVVWAGHCNCAEGRPWPLRGRCGALGVTHGSCNGHPTRRGPGKGRLWVGGGSYAAVCRACECRNAHSKWAPTALCFLLFSCGP